MKLRTAFAAIVSVALLSVSANAADMGVRSRRAAPPPAPSLFAPVPISMWNGLYVGVSGGGGWGTSSHTATLAGFGLATGDFNVSGGLIGVTAGVNQNMGTWIWGVEADISGADIQGTSNIFFPGAFGATLTSKLESLGTVRGRVGLNEGFWYPYLTGGLAFGSVRGTAAFGGGTLSDAQMRWGWTIGAGVEYQLNPVWTLKAEYLYVDLGNTNNMLFDQVNFTTNIFRVGANYKLNLM
jgi:outer membrane immunogenic protein